MRASCSCCWAVMVLRTAQIHAALDMFLVDPIVQVSTLAGIARRLRLAMEAHGMDIKYDTEGRGLR